jgi:hypothetical protein
LTRVLGVKASLRDTASDDAAAVIELQAGDAFDLLDDSLGWAWGYAGTDRRVGYVPSEALAAQ